MEFEANTVGIWANKTVNGANTTVFWGQCSEILENTVVFETNPVELRANTAVFWGKYSNIVR